VTDFIFDYLYQLLKKKAQLHFSCNLSPVLLNDLAYIIKLHQKCVEQGIEPQRIDIEISERVTHSSWSPGAPSWRTPNPAALPSRWMILMPETYRATASTCSALIPS